MSTIQKSKAWELLCTTFKEINWSFQKFHLNADLRSYEPFRDNKRTLIPAVMVVPAGRGMNANYALRRWPEKRGNALVFNSLSVRMRRRRIIHWENRK